MLGTLRNLRHVHDGSDVLNIPAWSADSAAHRLVVGPSGSGKTILLHILAGILGPTAGTVTFAGWATGAEICGRPASLR